MSPRFDDNKGSPQLLFRVELQNPFEFLMYRILC